MDANAKSRLALVLGIVILVVDLLWLSGSFSAYGRISGGSTGYRNYTGTFNSTYTGTFRGGGVFNINIVYGLVILVADLVWLYLDFSLSKTPAKAKKK